MEIGAYDLADSWLSASLCLFVRGTVLGTLGGRLPKQARLHAERLARDEATADGTLRRLLHDRPALALDYTSALAMAVVLALMIEAIAELDATTSRQGALSVVSAHRGRWRTQCHTRGEGRHFEPGLRAGGSPVSETLTITDNRTGRRYEVPIEDGAIRATALRQIKVADGDFG